MQFMYKLIPLFLLLMLVGCAPRESQIEDAIERELPNILGPADSYSVDVEGVEDNRFVERITVIGRDVEPGDTPVIDRLDAELIDVVYDRERRELESIERINATMRILPGDIRDYLEANRNLSNVSVRITSPNQLRVTFEPENIGQGLPSDLVVTATGNLEGRGQIINYNLTRVQAAGFNLPNFALSLFSRQLNPIADLGNLPYDIRVTSARVENNAIIARFTGEYP